VKTRLVKEGGRSAINDIQCVRWCHVHCCTPPTPWYTIWADRWHNRNDQNTGKAGARIHPERFSSQEVGLLVTTRMET
jgi:hypothetical protein